MVLRQSSDLQHFVLLYYFALLSKYCFVLSKYYFIYSKCFFPFVLFHKGTIDKLCSAVVAIMDCRFGIKIIMFIINDHSIINAHCDGHLDIRSVPSYQQPCIILIQFLIRCLSINYYMYICISRGPLLNDVPRW